MIQLLDDNEKSRDNNWSEQKIKCEEKRIEKFEKLRKPTNEQCEKKNKNICKH